MDMKNHYENMVKFLKNSLIFQMSLGSKELFHSNVWAWLIEQDNEFIKVFFPEFNISEYNILGVSRECCHRDIIIWLQKKGYDKKREKYYLVIENKIKSLQYYEQLEEYTKNLWENKPLLGVFTGIENVLEKDIIEIDNEHNNVNLTWKYVSYNQISKDILDIAQKSTNDVIKENLAKINEYCKVIDCINYLLQYDLENNKNKINYSCVTYKDKCNKSHEYLIELRIKDIFIKLKGSQILCSLKQNIENKVIVPKNYILEFSQSFHNGKATIDVRYTNWKNNDGDYFAIGIQLEDCQYRLIAESEKGEKLFHELSDIGWFDKNYDGKIKEDKIFGNATSMSKQFCKYGNNFFYQYYNIYDWQYDKVIEQIKEDLKKASKVIEKVNKL